MVCQNFWGSATLLILTQDESFLKVSLCFATPQHLVFEGMIAFLDTLCGLGIFNKFNQKFSSQRDTISAFYSHYWFWFVIIIMQSLKYKKASGVKTELPTCLSIIRANFVLKMVPECSSTVLCNSMLLSMLESDFRMPFRVILEYAHEK